VAAALADFDRFADSGAGGDGWQVWAFRLASELQSLLDWLRKPQRARMDGSASASCVRPDGTAQPSREDVLAVLGALDDAVDFTTAEMRVKYRALAYRLDIPGA